MEEENRIDEMDFDEELVHTGFGEGYEDEILKTEKNPPEVFYDETLLNNKTINKFQLDDYFLEDEEWLRKHIGVINADKRKSSQHSLEMRIFKESISVRTVWVFTGCTGMNWWILLNCKIGSIVPKFIRKI